MEKFLFILILMLMVKQLLLFLINFFFRFWPELFKENRIFQVLTPIVVAKKQKFLIIFYQQEEYDKWEKSQ